MVRIREEVIEIEKDTILVIELEGVKIREEAANQERVLILETKVWGW